MKEIETPKVFNELKQNLIMDIPIILICINLIALCVAYADEIDALATKLMTLILK